jgi:hypothetical protein
VTKCPPGTCFTCRLAGLKECGFRQGLPLVDQERTVVQKKTTRVWSGNGLTEEDRLRIQRFLRDRE